MKFKVGVDVGGTFTDVIFISSEGEVFTYKLLSTHEDYTKPLRERYQAVRSAVANSDPQAIVVSCTDFPTFDLIQYCEQDLKLPMVTSNQSCLRLALTQLGVRFEGGGLDV